MVKKLYQSNSYKQQQSDAISQVLATIEATE
jgi:hypothetical protein